MHEAILFKILHRKLKFRNPEHLNSIPYGLVYSESEYQQARDYLQDLVRKGFRYSYPGEAYYPQEFARMNEPPLFIEYEGEPVWHQRNCISVVGSREISHLSESWLNKNLEIFLKKNPLVLVSGGANGVDQRAHVIALKNKCDTVFVLPSGLDRLYPPNVSRFRQTGESHEIGKTCFLTEFEMGQFIHKSHFYFRNRLIAALGKFTLVVQASQKSGTLLTVHHCLQMGKPVLAVPAHPELSGFAGNLKLLHDGAHVIRNADDLHDFWVAESWSNSAFVC